MADEILVFDHVNGTVRKATLDSVPWVDRHLMEEPGRYEALRAMVSAAIGDLCAIAEESHPGDEFPEKVWAVANRLERAIGPESDASTEEERSNA